MTLAGFEPALTRWKRIVLTKLDDKAKKMCN